MVELMLKLFNREKLKSWYYNITMLLNPKYRKSLHKVMKNFRRLNKTDEDSLRVCLAELYFNRQKEDIDGSHMDEHLYNRLSVFRHRTIPWLDTLIPLDKCRTLEVGCGTGCTTISLAEQGCELTSLDIDEKSTAVAEMRCKLYNLKSEIKVASSTQISEIDDVFDLIVFPDSFEHMTYEERILSIRQAWGALKSGGYLVILGTPNRLYFYDRHSSLLPFYHWLPDTIAMKYAKYSPREACIKSANDETRFMRFGRGASFHEFEIAFDQKCSNFEVSSMQKFLYTPIFSRFAHRAEYKWNDYLRKLGSENIPDGFYYEQLHVAIKKPH